MPLFFQIIEHAGFSGQWSKHRSSAHVEGIMQMTSSLLWQMTLVSSISLMQQCLGPPGRSEHFAPPHIDSPESRSLQDRGQHTSPPWLATPCLQVSTSSPSGNQSPSPATAADASTGASAASGRGRARQTWSASERRHVTRASEGIGSQGVLRPRAAQKK